MLAAPSQIIIIIIAINGNLHDFVTTSILSRGVSISMSISKRIRATTRRPRHNRSSIILQTRLYEIHFEILVSSISPRSPSLPKPKRKPARLHPARSWPLEHVLPRRHALTAEDEEGFVFVEFAEAAQVEEDDYEEDGRVAQDVRPGWVYVCFVGRDGPRGGRGDGVDDFHEEDEYRDEELRWSGGEVEKEPSSLWPSDVSVDAVFEVVADDQHAGYGYDAGGFESGVCCDGLGLAGLLESAALQLDGVPAPWDGE